VSPALRCALPCALACALGCILSCTRRDDAPSAPAGDAAPPASGLAARPGPAGPREPLPASAPEEAEEPPTGGFALPEFDTPAPGPGREPKETYEAAKACVARRDYLGAWGLFSEEARAEADGNLPPVLGEWRYFQPKEFRRVFGTSVDEFEKLPIPEQWARLSLKAHEKNPGSPEEFARSEFVSESREEAAAEVVYRTPGGEERRMRLVLEGGVWRLARPRF
jgi:hypothetical protein